MTQELAPRKLTDQDREGRSFRSFEPSGAPGTLIPIPLRPGGGTIAKPDESDIANPLKHPELIAGEFNYVSPRIVKGNYPLESYKEMWNLCKDIPQGNFVRSRRLFGNEFIIDTYPFGFKPFPDIEVTTVSDKTGLSTTKVVPDIVQYLSDPEHRKSHPHEQIEEVVQFEIDSLKDPEHHRNRFFYPKPPNAQKVEYNYRKNAIERLSNKRAFIMLIRDPKTLKLIGLREGVRKIDDDSNIEPAIIVSQEPQYQHNGIATFSLYDTIGILTEAGAEKFEGSYQYTFTPGGPKNELCHTAWEERRRAQERGLRLIPGYISLDPQHEDDCMEFKIDMIK